MAPTGCVVEYHAQPQVRMTCTTCRHTIIYTPGQPPERWDTLVALFLAQHRPLSVTQMHNGRVTCPHCQEIFLVEGEEKA